VTHGADDAGVIAQRPDRTGILIVRIWLEGDSATGLRARITRTLDSTNPEQTIATAGDAAGILAVVRSWVDAFIDPA